MVAAYAHCTYTTSVDCHRQLVSHKLLVSFCYTKFDFKAQTTGGPKHCLFQMLVQEKRKRDAGQAKSAKNYVEEEKRLARNFGMYSGFDT